VLHALVSLLPNMPAGHEVANTQVIEALFEYVPTGQTGIHAPKERYRVALQLRHYERDKQVGH